MLVADREELIKQRLQRIRGNPSLPPEASIVIPVNAQADLENVVDMLEDISTYAESASLQVILVVNNFPAGQVPEAVPRLEQLGAKVVAIPRVQRPGEAVGFTARMHGLRVAESKHAIFFDADCRLPDPNRLLDWYVKQFRDGAQVAYTRVDYFDVERSGPIRTFLVFHFLARWIKRAIFRVPTTQGASYGGECALVLDLYDRGYLADEMNVGPTVKAKGGRIRYSGRLTVEASGRYLKMSWRKLFRYFWFRLRYNVRVLPVRTDSAMRTGRGVQRATPQSNGKRPEINDPNE